MLGARHLHVSCSGRLPVVVGSCRCRSGTGRSSNAWRASGGAVRTRRSAALRHASEDVAPRPRSGNLVHPWQVSTGMGQACCGRGKLGLFGCRSWGAHPAVTSGSRSARPKSVSWAPNGQL
jgi:hypothetical protein